jgi:hypothetical protein
VKLYIVLCVSAGRRDILLPAGCQKDESNQLYAKTVMYFCRGTVQHAREDSKEACTEYSTDRRVGRQQVGENDIIKKEFMQMGRDVGRGAICCSDEAGSTLKKRSVQNVTFEALKRQIRNEQRRRDTQRLDHLRNPPGC